MSLIISHRRFMRTEFYENLCTLMFCCCFCENLCSIWGPHVHAIEKASISISLGRVVSHLLTQSCPLKVQGVFVWIDTHPPPCLAGAFRRSSSINSAGPRFSAQKPPEIRTNPVSIKSIKSLLFCVFISLWNDSEFLLLHWDEC